jgi:hypothetical protein
LRLRNAILFYVSARRRSQEPPKIIEISYSLRETE